MNTEQFLEQIDKEIQNIRVGVITTDAELKGAAEFLRAVKTRMKEVTEKRFSLTRPLDESKKNIIEMFEPHLSLLADAETKLKGAILAYERIVAEKRADEQRRADEIARKEEEDRKERLLVKAEIAFGEGEYKVAADLAEAALLTRVVAPNIAAIARPGVSVRSKWSYRIIDEKKIPQEFWILDLKKIGGYVRTMKDKASIPGIEVFEDEVIASTTL